MGLSLKIFIEKSYLRKLGYKNSEELLKDWANDHAKNWDANNLLSKLKTWQLNDISKGPIYKNDYIKALKSIKAKTILMPCKQDLYFRVEDNEYENKFIPTFIFKTN